MGIDRVLGSGFGASGLGFRVQGLDSGFGLRVQRSFFFIKTLRVVRLGPAVLEAGALFRKATGRSHG